MKLLKHSESRILNDYGYKYNFALKYGLLMKYHSILTPALASLCLLTSNSSLATESTESSSDEQARWFEIEVILFKQVSNNSQNTEQFSSTDLSAKKRKAFDLLAPYLQPDISSLKQLLPSCEQTETKLPYDLSITSYSLLPESNGTKESSVQSKSESDQNITKAQLDGNEEKQPSATMSVTILPAVINETTEEIAENKLTEQGYQSQYAAVELPVYNQYPIDSQMPLCVIPAEFFQQHLSSEQLESFSIDGFPVEKLTNTINGLEQWGDDESGEITWASDTPYLISQDSLHLKSIANRIRRSRNYAPLLHLGWRQVGESKRKAKAMKLYAGENLALRYQQTMAKQASEQQALEIQAILKQRQQARVNTAIENNSKVVSLDAASVLAVESSEAFSEFSIAEELRQQAKQQQLNTIFQQLSLLDNQKNSANESVTNEETMLTEQNTKRIVAQLSSDITVKAVPLNANSATENLEQTTPPLQPWSIDGLFKVHLNHYLYIDTELNIIDSSNASSALTAKQKLAHKENKASGRNKVISFKQDRRVITGEIHYFDHPHIGMVVQIRRFDPTKPADEAVSQSKK